MTFESIHEAVRWRADVVADWFRPRARKLKAVGRVLAATDGRDTRRAEADAARLQGRSYPRSAYEYDPESIRSRAAERAGELAGKAGISAPGKRILEVGAGDGMVGALLATSGHRCELVDLEDWRDERAKAVPFHVADSCAGLPFADGEFDLAYSFNAFEHMSDPAKAFGEMLRVTKPGGHVYLSFNPLYCSPWGLHAYHTLNMPYPQFLFSSGFLDRLLAGHGIVDLGKSRTQLQPLNRWKPAQYRALWRCAACRIVSENLVRDFGGLSLILEYPESFRGLGLTVEDVTASGIVVLAQKVGTPEHLG